MTFQEKKERVLKAFSLSHKVGKDSIANSRIEDSSKFKTLWEELGKDVSYYYGVHHVKQENIGTALSVVFEAKRLCALSVYPTPPLRYTPKIEIETVSGIEYIQEGSLCLEDTVDELREDEGAYVDFYNIPNRFLDREYFNMMNDYFGGNLTLVENPEVFHVHANLTDEGFMAQYFFMIVVRCLFFKDSRDVLWLIKKLVKAGMPFYKAVYVSFSLYCTDTDMSPWRGCDDELVSDVEDPRQCYYDGYIFIDSVPVDRDYVYHGKKMIAQRVLYGAPVNKVVKIINELPDEDVSTSDFKKKYAKYYSLGVNKAINDHVKSI